MNRFDQFKQTGQNIEKSSDEMPWKNKMNRQVRLDSMRTPDEQEVEGQNNYQPQETQYTTHTPPAQNNYQPQEPQYTPQTPPPAQAYNYETAPQNFSQPQTSYHQAPQTQAPQNQAPVINQPPASSGYSGVSPAVAARMAQESSIQPPQPQQPQIPPQGSFPGQTVAPGYNQYNSAPMQGPSKSIINRYNQTLATLNRTIKIVHADASQEVLSYVAQIQQVYPNLQIISAYTGPMVLDFARAYKPDVLVINNEMPIIDGITVGRQIINELGTPVILVTPPDVETQSRAKSNNIVNFLVKPGWNQLYSLDDFAEAVAKVLTAPPTANQQNQPPRNAVPQDINRLMSMHGSASAIYSVKGGSGKTTITTNLALIAQKYANSRMTSDRIRVALWELDMSYSCHDLMLNIDNNQNITDLIRYYDEDQKCFRDETVLDTVMYTEKETGLKVLLGPSNPIEADLITEAHVSAIMTLLRKNFDYIFIDTSTDLGKGSLLKALDLCDRIYVVTPMEIISIRNTQRLLSTFKSQYFGYPENKVKVILNMVNESAGFTLQNVYEELGVQTWGNITEDRRTVVKAANSGKPIALYATETKIFQDLYALAMGILPKLPTDMIKNNRSAPVSKNKESFIQKLLKVFGGSSDRKSGKKKKSLNSKKRG